ncbi:MAG TPA: ribonuclease E/G, partial [Candidatus Acidoferrales bacterium]|nr:ribonuclease E/G [Candidatus Acidoferrales bacterium]
MTRVLPGMQSSFVDIGLDSDAFLYVTDFLEGIEELDEHVETAGEKISAPTDQGGLPSALGETAERATEIASGDASFRAPEGDSGSHELANFQAPAPPMPAVNPPPALNTAQPDRPRYENRNRQGRDFGQRGGRRGGRFNRGGRGGGGRGGGGRYGRELPQSKYASPRTYEDRGGDAGDAPEGHVSVILPGESLARYKDKLPSENPPAAIEQSTTLPDEQTGRSPILAESAESVTETAATSSASEFRPERRENTRPVYPGPSSSGLEPLPGETLAKWKQRPLEAPEPSESEPMGASAFHEDTELQSEPEMADLLHPDELHEVQQTAGLSEDEAASLAEHVAEAQSEQAEREAEVRGFAAETSAEAVDELVGTETDDAEAGSESEAEEVELEQEEADAEAEGMIAPAPEIGNEAQQELAVPPEAIAPESVSPTVLENSQPQGQQPWKARIRDDFRARMQHPARRGGRDRGRRDDRGRRFQRGPGGHGGHYRPQARRPQLIADLLKQGQEIIVQIAKEPLGKKGARITSHVALPGRFLVYMPTLDHTGVSRKIASPEERARLRHLVNDAKGSAGGGFIVR